MNNPLLSSSYKSPDFGLFEVLPHMRLLERITFFCIAILLLLQIYLILNNLLKKDYGNKTSFNILKIGFLNFIISILSTQYNIFDQVHNSGFTRESGINIPFEIKWMIFFIFPTLIGLISIILGFTYFTVIPKKNQNQTEP